MALRHSDSDPKIQRRQQLVTRVGRSAKSSSARSTDGGLTMFDSTGLAIQDVAAVHVVYENLQRSEDGLSLSLI